MNRLILLFFLMSPAAFAATPTFLTFSNSSFTVDQSGNSITVNPTNLAASQTEVNAGTVANKFVSPATLAGTSLTVQPYQFATNLNGFVWTPSCFTNEIDGSGFGLTNYNTQFFWNANQPYIDDGGVSYIGCYTNNLGRFIMNDVTSSYTLIGFDTNLTDFVADWIITTYPPLFTNGIIPLNSSSSPDLGGTNTATAGTFRYLLNQTNSIVSAGLRYTGEVTATNGTTVVPCYSQSTPTWMWNAFGQASGANMTENGLTNVVRLYTARGLDPYIDGYMLDSGIWGPVDANGHYSYITNNWLVLGGLQGAYTYVHTNTYNKTFILWSGIGGSVPYANPDLFDMTNIVTWSDGVSLDASSLVLTNADNVQMAFERQVRNYRRIASGRGKPFPLSSNLAQFSGINWQDTQLLVDNLFLYIPDNITSYNLFVNSIHSAVPYLKYLRTGQYVKFPDVVLNMDTNSLQSVLLMYQCVLPASGFYGSTNGIDGANVMISLTNADVHAIFKDALLAKGFLVATNGQDELWARKLSGNRAVVVFWNPSNVNHLGSLTARAIDLGYPQGQQFYAKRIFVSTNYVATDSITVSSLPGVTSEGFLLTPVGALEAAGVSTNGSSAGQVLESVGGVAVWTNTLSGNGSGITNATTSYSTNIVNGNTNVNLLTRTVQWTIPVSVSAPAATLGSAEIDAQIQRSDGVWVTVADCDIAGGAASIIATNKEVLVVSVPSGASMRVTNSTSGTGYIAGLDATKTNTFTVFP